MKQVSLAIEDHTGFNRDFFRRREFITSSWALICDFGFPTYYLSYIMAKRISKILLGFALLPFCLGYLWQLFSMIFSITYKTLTPYYFAGGTIAYLAIHLLFKRPILTYVFGHELTHAFFAMLFGGSLKSFHASDRGGRVTITKSNFIITLAPYFFPLYTFGILILYYIAKATAAGSAAINALIFFSGVSFTFHLVLTFIFLQTDQNDIKEVGAIFSYPLIFLFNILFTAFLINVYMADHADYLRFLLGGIMKSINLIVASFSVLYGLMHQV